MIYDDLVRCLKIDCHPLTEIYLYKYSIPWISVFCLSMEINLRLSLDAKYKKSFVIYNGILMEIVHTTKKQQHHHYYYVIYKLVFNSH